MCMHYMNPNSTIPPRANRVSAHHGIPDYIRSENGPEFTVQAVRQWLETVLRMCDALIMNATERPNRRETTENLVP
jgi:hypothetical protein